MYQETLELIDKLNSDAQKITELSKKFFSSISIKTDHQIISTGSSIPTLKGYIITEPEYATSYTWCELSTEMLDLKVELLNKYNLWHEMSRSLIKKYLIDRLEAFDESYEKGRKYITLDYQPNKKEDTKFFYEFQPHLNFQQNIISSLSFEVKDVETKNDTIFNTFIIKRKMKTCWINIKSVWKFIVGILILLGLIAGANSGLNVIFSY